MFSRIEAKAITDILLPLNSRPSRGVYFIRIAEYSAEVKKLVISALNKATDTGTIIEEQIPKPDERQIAYFKEKLGDTFQAEKSFIYSMITKWLPEMSESSRQEFSVALNEIFDEVRAAGKSEGIIKNIYSKIMCWMYYRFERIITQLGTQDLPVIVYIGSHITAHELMLLRIVSGIGADILIVEPAGDAAYQALDHDSRYSQLLGGAGAGNFPTDFSVKSIRTELNEEIQKTKSTFVVNEHKNVQTPKRNIQTSRSNSKNSNIDFSTNTASTKSVEMTTMHIQTGRTTPSVSSNSSIARLEDHFIKPHRQLCVNAWMNEAAYTEILTPPSKRSDDSNLYCVALIRMLGVYDRSSFVSEMMQFYQGLNKAGRNIWVQEEEIRTPDNEETRKIHRHSYSSVDEMIADLVLNLPVTAPKELQQYMEQAFMHCMLKEARLEPNLNKLTATGVYMLCWLARYYKQLFRGWREGDIPCFILLGGAHNPREALFVDLLAELPVDILILVPNLKQICQFSHPSLLDLKYDESITMNRFPSESNNYQAITVTRETENELGEILYNDSGLYRDKQFSKASSIILHTTYDEMYILWNQELKFRPNFFSDAEHVNMPVIFAKVSGVEKGRMMEYWQKIKLLKTPDTLFLNQFPILSSNNGSSYMQLAQKAITNGRVNRNILINDRNYPFGLLRKELQEHIFDKIQIILDHRYIKGIFENGTEYTVLATMLSMRKELLRLIQAFDFTKKNPKVVCISTKETMASLEDSIMLVFLSLLGFDIALFVPTGYQTIERYLNDYYPIEFQTGDYIYDQEIPDFDTIPAPKNRAWLNKIIRRIY